LPSHQFGQVERTLYGLAFPPTRTPLCYAVVMARKHCPQCNLVTGASTTTCSGCGHTFESVALAATARAKRCIQCGLVHPSTVRRCRCGFDFDVMVDPVEWRALLVERRSHGRSLVAGALVLGTLAVVLCGALMMIAGWVAIGALVAVWGVSARMLQSGRRILHAAHIQLDDLDGKSEALARAQLRS
jgi:hypothetical protein